jgi:hypothetical protein
MEELEAEARFELREELEEEVRNDLLWDGWDVVEIWLRYGWDMVEIWLRYGWVLLSVSRVTPHARVAWLCKEFNCCSLQKNPSKTRALCPLRRQLSAA